MEKIYLGLFFFVSGYCLGRQLIALYQAMVHLRKLRRDTENAYMNMMTSMKDPLDEIA